MRYYYVENGMINNGSMNLPKNWENISNFSNLSHEQLISLGLVSLAIKIIKD